jgi:hypothetical protein
VEVEEEEDVVVVQEVQKRDSPLQVVPEPLVRVAEETGEKFDSEYHRKALLHCLQHPLRG